MSHLSTEPAVESLPRRDLASSAVWQRSLERSLYRREQAAVARKQVGRRKGAAVATSAAMLGATAAPTLVAAQTSSGSGTAAASEVRPEALEDPGEMILLELGDSGPDVAAVQRELAIQTSPGLEVDGVFGPATHQAVIAFQRSEGLSVDGVVGPETWAALFSGQSVAFVPTGTEPAVEPAVAIDRPAPPTRAASHRPERAEASDFNGGNFVVMVQRKRSASSSEGSGSSGSNSGAGQSGGRSLPSPGGGGGSFAGNPGSPGGGGSNAGGGGGSAGGGGGSNAGGGHAGGPVVCGLSSLRNPVNGTITGRFGDDRGDHAHAGVDIAAPSGTPVRASACGRITFAGVQSGYGKMVCIQHTPAFETCYAHLSSIRFESGYVKTGQVIGRVGCTGSCTGPHVHFETRVRGDARDPMPYLRGTRDVPGENPRYAREQRRREAEREALEAARRGEPIVTTQTTATGGSEPRTGGGSGTVSTQTRTAAPAPAPAPLEPAPAPVEEAAPVEPAPVEPAPVEEAAPVEPAPVEEAPVEEAPVEPAPVEEAVAPVEPAPAPVEPAPVEPAPVEEAAPVEPTPVEPAPVEPAPVEEAVAPVEPAPAPVEPAPVEPAPVEEAAPVEPAPVEEAAAPVEPAPVEEAAPVEPAPVEPAPVEEAPVEETPVAPETTEETVTTP